MCACRDRSSLDLPYCWMNFRMEARQKHELQTACHLATKESTGWSAWHLRNPAIFGVLNRRQPIGGIRFHPSSLYRCQRKLANGLTHSSRKREKLIPAENNAFTSYLELDMQAEAPDRDWPAILVVAGIIDVLQVGSHIDPTPDMCGVIGLDNIFASIAQGPVAQ